MGERLRIFCLNVNASQRDKEGGEAVAQIFGRILRN